MFEEWRTSAANLLCTPRYSKRKLFIIYGKWTEGLWGIDPAAYESFRKQERRGDPLRKAKLVRRCSGTCPGGAAGGRAQGVWETGLPPLPLHGPCWERLMHRHVYP